MPVLLARTLRALTALCLALAALSLGAHLRSQSLVDQTADRIDAGRGLTARERMEAYIHFAATRIPDPGLEGLPNDIVRAWYRFNPMHPGPADVLRWGSDFRGPCGSRSRVVVAMLKSRGIHARLLLLLDGKQHSIHTVVETYIDGRWVVADPTYDIVFHRRDGRLATRDDLRRDPGLLALATEGREPYPSIYSYTRAAHTNWHKIPIVLPAAHGILTALLGPDIVYEMGEPTELWSRPRAAFAIGFALAAVFFGCCAGVAERRIVRRPALERAAALAGAGAALR